MGQFTQNGVVYEELPDGKVRVVGYAQPGIQTKAPDPKLPGALQGQDLSNTRAAIDINNAPIDRTGKVLSNQKTAQEIALDRSKVGIGLSQQYASDARVKAYRDVLPQVTAAMAAPDNAQGDLSIIYAFAKTMDPGSAVRGEEMEMAQGSSPLLGRLQSMIGMVNAGKRLPPETRRQLVNTMREKGNQYNLAYSEARKQYLGLAKEAGLDANTVIGPHDGGKYQQIEADYKGAPVVNLDGSEGARPVNGMKTSDKEIHDFIVKYQGLPLDTMQELAQEKLGRRIDNLPDVMDHLKKTGILSDLNVRTEAGKGEFNGIAKGFLGAVDRAAEGVQNGVNGVFGTNFQSATDTANARNQYFAQRPVDQDFETAGRIGGATLMSLVTKNPYAAGAIGNTLMTDSRDGGAIAKDALVGAAGGKAGDLAVRGITGLLTPRVADPVRKLAAEGYQPTMGDLLGPRVKQFQDRAVSLPMVGPRIEAANDAALNSFNRIPANRALGPIGQTLPADVPAGHQAVGHVREQLGNAYDNALNGVDIGIDPTYATRLNYIGQRSPLRPQEFDQFADIVQREVGGSFANRRGVISGREYKKLDERLGDLSARFNKSDDPYARDIGNALSQVKDQTRALARRQSPQLGQALRAADEGYANYAILRQGAQMSPADGLVTPGQLRTAIRQADRSVGKGATARGEATMQDLAVAGSEVIPPTIGNSGTADRLNQTSGKAWALGTALSPLYSDPVQEFIRQVMLRQPSAASKRISGMFGALPAGSLGGLIPYGVNSGQ